jgi:hypothetical protein
LVERANNRRRMASLQLGPYTGGGSSSRRRSGGGRSAAAVKQLLSRLRSTWRRRRAAARPRRRANKVSFGYDLQSYRQNFDDGLACSDRRRL